MALSDEGLYHLVKDNGKRRLRPDSCAGRTEDCMKSLKTAPPASPSNCSQQQELVLCHVQLLKALLERLTAQRALKGLSFSSSAKYNRTHLKKPLRRRDVMVADEITEVVEVQSHGDVSLQSTDEGSESSLSDTNEEDWTPSTLSTEVLAQLQLFVEQMASCYLSVNPFHNFMHASHATFSCYQLLRKVVVQDLPPVPMVTGPASDDWSVLPMSSSDCTAVKAFAGDALAHFALIFSALIHDVNHAGVPNFLLAKEKPEAAKKYKNRSIAEQTSLDVAWEVLEQDCFSDLRECIFPTPEDYIRFRAIVVNIVMATDAFDVTLRDFQDKKWAKAFRCPPECPLEHRNRKATVMMDLIMMCSDISHTMQSFDVYCEWNERLYREIYAAYRDGRSDNDPSTGWVAGELIFFDKHIIPLAMRLQESGMFGVTADAILKSARNNRKEWEKRGKRIFEDLQARVTGSSNNDDYGPARKKAKVSTSVRST